MGNFAQQAFILSSKIQYLFQRQEQFAHHLGLKSLIPHIYLVFARSQLPIFMKFCHLTILLHLLRFLTHHDSFLECSMRLQLVRQGRQLILSRRPLCKILLAYLQCTNFLLFNLAGTTDLKVC